MCWTFLGSALRTGTRGEVREAGLGQSRGRWGIPTEACANHRAVLRWHDLHSPVEVRELDLSILSAGCRRPSGEGHDLGRGGSLQPRAIPGQG